MKYVVFMLLNPALLRFWFKTDLGRKNSASYLTIQAVKTFFTMVTRWSFSTSNFYALIGPNLTGEFMGKIYAASWNLLTLTAKADRVLCQLGIFLTAFFHWMYKMKYSCYQESSLIRGWFVYWVLLEKWVACQSRESDFGWHRYCFSPCLMRKMA